ncbi:class IV adenylate cyclase [Fimbriiglobus ruber]|uniref:Adenylate cyclase n=1 Tax=Fimbriiglobus ruber TaxID=1908690 RepID=A0A225DJX7_9BACT|nr:class IV adenylate cyclase [Fimbriiglobus ruber]OWK41672.1 Adenylate cyclase [Fimbriiglobus ruber]
MLEVEVKYRVADWDRVVATLAGWGATAAAAREDTDHYFNSPDRDFAKTDEALRLRRIGTDNFLTYKGPRRDAATKTRTEIELPVAGGSAAAATAVKFLAHLGYRPVAVVSKVRRVYRFERAGFAVEVCLDDVGAIGRFVEIEIMADEPRFEAAKAAVIATAADLGLTDQERRSYLELLLNQSATAKTPAPRA